MTGSPRRPATPSPSATLILIRQHGADVQVYLLRRSADSPFMPGTYVFPGGRMDDDDKDTAFWKNHVDLPSEGLAGALGGPVETMLPYAVAAIRETWEEAGLLVATPAGKRSAAEPVESGRSPFSMKIQAEGTSSGNVRAWSLAPLDHPGADAAALRYLFLRCSG